MRPLILFASYPVMTHLGVVMNNPYLVWGAFSLFYGWALIGIQYKNRVRKMVFISAGVCLLMVLFWLAYDSFVVFLVPPILINISLFILFAKTCLPGETPLITQLAEIEHGKLNDDLLKYTRIVTLVWLVFFAGMAMESLLLGLFAPLEIWSLYTNFINYLFMLLIFAIEYRIRVTHYKHLQHHGFIKFLKSLTKTKLQNLNNK